MRLCRKNYEQIEKIVDEMYEDLDFAETPVDVFKLCQKLQINLIKYSNIESELLSFLSNDGFTILDKENRQYKIFYNDLMPDEKIRFTIMREIGHIMLDHKKLNKKNEKEANIFANFALDIIEKKIKLREVS